MSDSLQKLANAIAAGAQTTKEAMQSAIHDCLAERFTKASLKGLRNGDAPFIRNAYSRGGDSSHVAYAGLVPPESAPSGAYGGASLVWFPSGEGSIISYVIGTLGLSPDEGILTKPGHKRRVASLRSYLAEQGAPSVWARQDPAALNNLMPDTEIEKLNAWQPVFGKYRSELYCIAKVPQDNPALARLIVRSFLDLYAKERHWQHFKDFDGEASELLAKLNDHWLAPIEQEEIENLLKERRFVVLQGPPGTGKSHVSEAIAKAYNGNSLFTQFHPSTTYEDFVIGLSPNPQAGSLNFKVRKGHLIRAAELAKDGPALLIIDEMNRADLGRVLGEAIYLFEANSESPRSLKLAYPHDANDSDAPFVLPENLHVLATMNTADRSIASMDIAIRRRFAFVTMMPDKKVVETESSETGVQFFNELCSVFLEYAPDDALSLLPGHSYFMVTKKSDLELRNRFRYELIPLLDDYIREGILGPATGALHAVRDRMADFASANEAS